MPRLTESNGTHGMALMQENKVSLCDARNLAVGATIMVVGIGGNIGFSDGFIPMTIPVVFPNGLPAIARLRCWAYRSA